MFNKWPLAGPAQTTTRNTTRDTITVPAKSLRQIKEYDTIEVLEFIENIDFEQSRGTPLTSLFPEFVLKFSTNLFKHKGMYSKVITYAYFNEDTNFVECYQFYTILGQYFHAFTICLDNPHNIKERFSYIHGDITAEDAEGMLLHILNVIGYVVHQMQDVNTIIKTERTRRNSPTNGTAPATPTRKTATVLNADKIVYKIQYSVSSYIKTFRKYRRHAQAWGVKGHPRKLANGKTIWVQPYKKGTGKKEPKKYLAK